MEREEKIILKAFAEAEKTCTVPDVLNYSRPIAGANLTLHHLLMILGGVAGIINIAVAVFLLSSHLQNWTKPREQKQYVRVIFFLIFLTITTFLSLTFYNASGFIDPIGQYYEGFAIVALYLLYCNLTVAEHPIKAVTYQDVKQEIYLGNNKAAQPGWLARSWIFVFQILVSRVATVVAAEVLFGTKCPLSKARTQGQLAATVIQSFSTGCAVVGVIFYERRTCKRYLQGHRPTLKLISFKGVVVLQALQEVIFQAIGETEAFFPMAPFYISYNDFTKGFPDLMFLWELTLMALLFLKAFNADEYRAYARQGAPILRNPVTAFLSCFVPTDYLIAGFSLCAPKKKGVLRNGDNEKNPATNI